MKNMLTAFCALATIITATSAQAGIFSYNETRAKSTCVSVDRRYEASFKQTEEGTKATFFTYPEVLNKTTDFRVVDKKTGKQYFHFDSLDTTDERIEQSTIQRNDFFFAGQHILLNLVLDQNKSQIIDLFCKDFPKENTPKSAVVVRLPEDFFATVVKNRSFPKYVNGVDYGSYGPSESDVNGAESFGQCELTARRWGTDEKTVGSQDITFTLDTLGQEFAYAEFSGFTSTHSFKLDCKQVSTEDSQTIEKPLNVQQMQTLLLNAFPKGMATVLKNAK